MKKTKIMMTGVLAAATLASLAACGEERGYSAPTGTDCDDWEWDKSTGTYYCDDNQSSIQAATTMVDDIIVLKIRYKKVLTIKHIQRIINQG